MKRQKKTKLCKNINRLMRMAMLSVVEQQEPEVAVVQVQEVW